MTAIAVQGTGLRHVRKTIAFDGGANNGNLGDQIPVFTTTGTVLMERLTAFVTEDLACSASAATQLAFQLTGSGTFATAAVEPHARPVVPPDRGGAA